ncbi:MAG: hypothetical protein PHC97_01690 [Patescibacteria group bacterium]|nr:hypothetical protein [Patescibacteria group bacterium]
MQLKKVAIICGLAALVLALSGCLPQFFMPSAKNQNLNFGFNLNEDLNENTNENANVNEPAGDGDTHVTNPNMTRERCIELMAYSLYGVTLMQQGNTAKFMLISQKVANLEKQYNVNTDDYDEVCNNFLNEEQFMIDVEKRMQQLGADITTE